MDELFNAFDDTTTLSKSEMTSLSSKTVNIQKENNIISSRKRKATDAAVVEVTVRPTSSVVHTSGPLSSSDPVIAGTGTLEKNMISFSVLPPEYIAPPALNPDYVPAKTYPFTLDPFQQRAIDYIEQGESVLVSAHTSAGKTAVAEYAIAKSLRDGQRVIYTSPIKALSNQKYRDLEAEFGDVGLMTGDITINPTATCLIMTTEILRSMLYRGSEVMREVAWVIYDEIHYMRDKERGVVWEESIILLPHKVRFAFLSATIPNSKQFAQWICHIKRQPCHVVYTDYRPTPLQHYVFPAGGDGLHLVVDEKGKFRQDNFDTAMGTLAGDNNAEESFGKKRKQAPKSAQKKVGSDVYRIVKLIMEREYDPVIIFSFSKKDCEAYAMLMSKLDFNTEEEHEMIEQVFRNAMDSLSDDDKKLPQVDSILPLLKRGIGIHHGGLLPILKEVVEIMFGEGLLKCLFATETFSMGLNMPAKTVVFTQCRKYDGKEFRWITSGEYIQMSGRAGRRGLDARGIVIQMLNEKMEPQSCKDILYGKADPLFSTFHLKYNMLLNLLRVEDADAEYMIKQSFHQFQNEQIAPGLEEELARLMEDNTKIVVDDESVVADYYHACKQMKKLKREIQNYMNAPSVCTPFLNPGRLILIADGKHTWEWGIVLNFIQGKEESSTEGKASSSLIVHVLLNCVPTEEYGAEPTPGPKGSMGRAEGEMKICPIPASCIENMSTLRVYIPKDLRSLETRQSVGRSLLEVQRRFPDGMPSLDPIVDMEITSDAFKEKFTKVENVQASIVSSPFHTADDKDTRYALYDCKMENENKIRHLNKEIKATKSLVLRDDLRRKKRILRRMEFTNTENVIEMKGRTACEISTSDELVLTEMMFNGVFNALSVNESVALLSCLVNEEKKKEETLPLAESLHAPIRALQEIARTVATTCVDCNVELDVDEFVDKFNTNMVDLVLAWCQGAKFAQICKMGKTFEGTIIRTIRRLEELLRQLCLAAHAIGNTELEEKFEQGRVRIKRDIVFAASLYL